MVLGPRQRLDQCLAPRFVQRAFARPDRRIFRVTIESGGIGIMRGRFGHGLLEGGNGLCRHCAQRHRHRQDHSRNGKGFQPENSKHEQYPLADRKSADKCRHLYASCPLSFDPVLKHCTGCRPIPASERRSHKLDQLSKFLLKCVDLPCATKTPLGRRIVLCHKTRTSGDVHSCHVTS